MFKFSEIPQSKVHIFWDPVQMFRTRTFVDCLSMAFIDMRRNKDVVSKADSNTSGHNIIASYTKSVRLLQDCLFFHFFIFLSFPFIALEMRSSPEVEVVKYLHIVLVCRKCLTWCDIF